LKLLNKSTAFLLVALYLLFNLFPGSRAIFISNPDRLMNSLVNLLPVGWSNDYASLIKDVFYVPQVTGHHTSPP
jgi:hypothetical protein